MICKFSPGLASTAEPAEGGKLFAPSAARNTAPLCDLLAEFASESGRALEIASGTGQHVVAFAQRLPGLAWQPSDPDPARRASIDAWAAEAGRANIAPAIALDACAPGWGVAQAGQDLVVVVNLLHLISQEEAATLIAEAARALAPGGRLVIYGPFLRAGEVTSEGDAAFDAKLRTEDPAIGYKDDFETIDLLHAAGLELVAAIEMPANNLALVSARPRI